MFHEGVVLFGCAFGEWLEPVGVVGHSHLCCPFFHTFCHGVGNGTVEACAVVDNVYESLIDVGWQVFVHFLSCEDVFRKVFRRSFLWCRDLHGFFLESFFHDSES